MHINFSAPERYVRADHEIVRHPRLNGTAKTLLLWALSLPPGSRDTVLTIGQRMPEGRQAVSTARAQLKAEGYLHVRRGQHPTNGTWHTEVLASSVPLTTPEQISEAWAATTREAGEVGQASPTHQDPTLGGETGRAVGTSPKGENNGGKNLPPAAPDPAPAPAAPPPRPPGPVTPGPVTPGPVAAAGRVLRRLLAGEARLSLGLAEILALAPLAAEWLARDRSEDRLGRALLDALPQGPIFAPLAFLRRRLERKMPPPPALGTAPEPPLPGPMMAECGTCRAPVQVGRRCRSSTCAVDPVWADESVAEMYHRGAATARAAMTTRGTR
ncbi:hypothetical protein OG455_22615 [Kitasatospora sp. NBC_01287]|uniref:hypothetical protein n=1 Tax=Kitasatospora sp. NBC_01287 TaxID=2903573 RepID=UPI00224F4876|nr:hypothetical protein [Kitasatospora sp. NBC_01287]MCX4748272.1 hypothetical protein [Kitasatospora sp. NBC_01287]